MPVSSELSELSASSSSSSTSSTSSTSSSDSDPDSHSTSKSGSDKSSENETQNKSENKTQKKTQNKTPTSRFSLYNAKRFEQLLQKEGEQNEKETRAKKEYQKNHAPGDPPKVLIAPEDKTDICCSKTAFEKIVKEISKKQGLSHLFTKTAIEALQIITESYIAQMLKEARTVMKIRKRKNREGELVLSDLLHVIKRRPELNSLVPALKRKVKSAKQKKE